MTTSQPGWTKGPWVLKQPESWPFDLLVQTEDGQEVVMARRWAYSTRHKTLEDVMDGQGFPRDEVEGVQLANRRQVADMALVAAAPSLYEALEKLVHELAPLEYDDEILEPGSASAYGGYYQRPVVVAALQALRLARGEQP